MAKPQTNTNQLVNDVANKIISNEQFGEWAAAKFRRKIEKLPTELEQSQLYGLFYTAQRNADLAIKAFDKAMVSSSANSNVALNYLVALNRLGLHQDEIDRCGEFSKRFESPKLYNRHLLNLVWTLDLNGFESWLLTLKKMEQLDTGKITVEGIFEKELLDTLVEAKKVTSAQLKSIASIVLAAAKTCGVRLLGNQISHRQETEHISIEFAVDAASCNSDTLCDLNLLLINKLIEHEYDLLPVVVQFMRLPDSKPIQNIHSAGIKNVG